MNELPDNVIVLADRRRVADEFEYDLMPHDPRPLRSHLRLVSNNDHPEPFSLEVFMRRAMIVMAEQEAHPHSA